MKKILVHFSALIFIFQPISYSMQKLMALKINELESAFNHDPYAPIGEISWSKYDYDTTITGILYHSLKSIKKN